MCSVRSYKMAPPVISPPPKTVGSNAGGTKKGISKTGAAPI